MSAKPSTGRVRSVYEFIKAHRDQYSAQTMCRVLGVAPSGYMVWDGTDLNGKSRVFTVLLTQILLTQWGSGSRKV